MRLLFVAHGFPPREPGVWTVNLVDELSRRHSVWVYAAASDPARSEFLQWDETVGRASVRRVVRTGFDPERSFAEFREPRVDRQFMAFVDEVRPDAVHVDHVYKLSSTLPESLRARGIPTVLALYDHWWACQRVHLVRGDGTSCAGPDRRDDCVRCVEGDPGGVRRRAGPAEPDWRLALHDLRRELMRRQLLSPEVVTTISDDLRQRLNALCELPAGRLRTVELGLPPLARPVAHRPAVPAGAVRIVLLCGTQVHKGALVVAHAVRTLLDPRYELHLHGPVDAQGAAQLAEALPAARIHGPYGRGELPDILGGADIGVVPSLAPETFGIAAREFAQAGVPLIASRIGALPEFVRDGENGLLVEPGAVAPLAEALHRLGEDAALRRRLAAAASRVRSVEDYAAEMEALYAEAIALARAPTPVVA